MKINKCVCFDVSFEELKDVAQFYKITSIDQLLDKKDCATACRMCVPYIKKMLQTGASEFIEILD